MKMKIVGYSERGAMNALFYGMALSNAEEDMNKFLKLSGIKDSFHDFELYMEPSLSDFGDCDLIFTAKNEDGKLCAFFVEAKVSAQSKYSLEDQLDRHISDMQSQSGKEHSNLFYQLREKYELMNLDEDEAEEGRLILDELAPKKIGNNGVVLYLYNILRQSTKQYYLAVIPGQKTNIQREYFGFDINYVYWEDLMKSHGKYLESTFDFNNKGGRHQILNNIHQVGDAFTQNLGEIVARASWRHVSLQINGDEIIAKEKVRESGIDELYIWKRNQNEGPIRLIDELLKYIFGDQVIPSSCDHVRHDLLKALGATIYYAKENSIGKVCLQYDQETCKEKKWVEKLCGCVGLELNGEAKTLNGIQVRIEWN